MITRGIGTAKEKIQTVIDKDESWRETRVDEQEEETAVEESERKNID